MLRNIWKYDTLLGRYLASMSQSTNMLHAQQGRGLPTWSRLEVWEQCSVLFFLPSGKSRTSLLGGHRAQGNIKMLLSWLDNSSQWSRAGSWPVFAPFLKAEPSPGCSVLCRSWWTLSVVGLREEGLYRNMQNGLTYTYWGGIWGQGVACNKYLDSREAKDNSISQLLREFGISKFI